MREEIENPPNYSFPFPSPFHTSLTVTDTTVSPYKTLKVLLSLITTLSDSANPGLYNSPPSPSLSRDNPHGSTLSPSPTAMQSSNLRHAVQQPQEFPFTQPESPFRPATLRSQSSIANGNNQLSALFGKSWQGNDEELVKHHEEEQKAFGEKREL